ncbi:hypothetical protein ACGFI4_27215 [Micromonospora carbonacea]|uniref:Uncharacterized protein n=1 Tax=Micromonospora carbonacea TaxID=47853 RepID=A0A1C4ZX86_9ACTN|nr:MULTISPECIES: hypothetical protein [Micromonospora]MBB5826598.1 hypothetical protein [Micromonospora carbonacea]QLD26097.1 hypothetical protein HXZ27_19350 [Micromonospora carbonacea]WFE55902.1 hypothetical protein O7633_03080 [Micromonospora sp. WMMD712]SCF37555.1 hypothetical protein GA0070563_110116 [Micromonospora carbonacea]
MTSERRVDRASTDEPDGVPAMEASLRPPGDSVRSGADSGDDFADLPAEQARPARDTSRAGYDVDAVSGAADPSREG